MKNITLSAPEELIVQAREEAHARKTTLNQLFRNWLNELTAARERSQQVGNLLDRLEHIDAGGKFDRETINER